MRLLKAHISTSKIKLASKLRELYQKWSWSRLFSNKKSPHTFSDTNPSNFIICKFKHFQKLFSLQNSKTTYYEPFWLISNAFNFSVRLVSNGLKGILGASLPLRNNWSALHLRSLLSTKFVFLPNFELRNVKFSIFPMI